MKFRIRIGAIAASLLLVAISGLSGCATTGMQRSEKTNTSMQTVETDIRQAMAQVDVTSASLEELVRPGQSDVKKAFGKYSDSVEKMDTLGKRLFNHVDKMSAQGKDYFEEWQKQGNAYTNPEIQSLSEQRRSDLNTEYAKIAAASVGVKGAYKAYMSDNREIKTYLSNDLTSKGVESITPVSQKSVRDGDNLKESVRPVLGAIDNARTELARGGNK